MDPIVRASLFLRRTVRRALGMTLTLGLAAYVASGGATAPVSVLTVSALALYTLLLVKRFGEKLSRTGQTAARTDIELGLLLAVGLFAALLRFDGGLSGTFSPAVYALVALVASFARPGAGIVVVLFVVGFEVALRRMLLRETELRPILTHAAFVLTFALLNLLLLRAEIARIRIRATARLEDELKRLKEDARRYRLTGGSDAKEREEDRLARSSVEEIHESVHYALELLRRTLDLHTAVLLWQNDAGTHFRISELSSSSEDISDAPISVGDGVFAVVVGDKKPVALTKLRPSYKVPYYIGPCPIQSFLAIPVLEGETVRGVLAIDRTSGNPFTPHEQELVAQAARYCHRAIQNERVFLQLERAKVEQSKLYRAARSLGAALGEKDVLDAGVRAAREIASFDLALVTSYDEDKKMHEVSAAKSSDGEVDQYVGLKFQNNTGLVSMVVKNKFPLPYKGEFDGAHQVVLTRRLPWPKLGSLLVLPLLLHDKPIGTLVLGARRRHAFGDSVRATLDVLASHLAVSLSNARMVQKLEQMATTDGLTGLFNKRAMLDAAEQKVQAAARFGRKLSVLIADIDFFKKVNDTHGHDVGDVVIRGLGDVLRAKKRNTDIVARFGGEEFVLLCEQTDETGAMMLAERIREELERKVFTTPQGPLSVTCSIGVATFPEAGGDWETLFKGADDALYVSKRTGRNRCTLHQSKKSDVRLLVDRAEKAQAASPKR
jgi:diguanylate cyclase (GGDEF)-like protein